jgi:hypothetical protein
MPLKKKETKERSEFERDDYLDAFTKDYKIEHFGEGEWIEEDDLVRFEHEGINCLVQRNQMGALCGYCEIPKGHKYFAGDYDDIPYEAHGGLTYSEYGPLGFWIGFDCAHSYDVVPACENMLIEIQNKMRQRLRLESSRIFERSYKNIEFVKQQCMKLAEQIKSDMK